MIVVVELACPVRYSLSNGARQNKRQSELCHYKIGKY